MGQDTNDLPDGIRAVTQTLQLRRVAVTGMGGLSPIGSDWDTISENLRSQHSGVRRFDEWKDYAGLNCHLGAPVEGFETPAHHPRKMRRAMGRVSLLSVRAPELALMDAGLLDEPILTGGRTGVCYGSSVGSPQSIMEFGQLLANHSTDSITANTYIKMMPHTTAAAVGMFFGLTGRMLNSSTACTSGSLSIGLGYEMIRYGLQDVMVAGGAEELNVGDVAAFDTLYAEGQRRYIESFSAYTRQFLEQLEKPPAESIEGIPPAIAVTQSNRTRY